MFLKKMHLSRVMATGMAAILMAASAGAETMYCMCTPDGQVNIRDRATTHSDIIGHLYAGDRVEILDSARSGGITWYRIDAATETGTGWVSGTYLVSESPVYRGTMATVEASGRAALRKAPDGQRIAWLAPGDRIMVISSSGIWSMTDRGYVQTQFLRFD